MQHHVTAKRNGKQKRLGVQEEIHTYVVVGLWLRCNSSRNGKHILKKNKNKWILWGTCLLTFTSHLLKRLQQSFQKDDMKEYLHDKEKSSPSTGYKKHEL